MSEPVNPLFEEEKEFLERKKLEYERALRGDVEQLKEQGVQIGKVALAGAGIASGVWLLSRLFGGRKRRKARAKAEYFDDYDEPDYHSQHFADFDEDEPSQWQEPDTYFGQDDEDATGGGVYHTDADEYDGPSATAPTESEDDDNGLGAYPDFPEHSSHQHGTLPAEAQEPTARPFWSEEHSHPTANLPYDDSRRLPEGSEFEEKAEVNTSAEEAPSPKRQLGPTLVAFAKSDIGKMLLGQAASVAIALVTKAVNSHLPSDAAETTNNSDLAVSTGTTDGYAHGHPATPQPAASDAHYAPADAPHYREPLA